MERPDPSERPAGQLAQLLIRQAAACRALGSPLYADLLSRAAADLLRGGPTARVLDGYLAQPVSSALPLRMLGAAHALVLTGQAPQLAAFYPSAGGSSDPGPGGAAAWTALRQTLEEHRSFIRPWLQRPPQTNEVGRGAALIGGLRHVVAEAARPVHLVEVGASAGLNLRADLFHVPGACGRHADASSPVILAGGWQGASPPEGSIEVIGRTGGDIDPIDPATAAGATTLTAYVWPDQQDRLDRLRGALALARAVPADLRQESATATLARTELADGSWTVLWHSIFRQYLNQEQRAELAAGVRALAAAATPAARFAYLYLEQSRAGDCPVTLTTWPGGRRRVLGLAPPHGVPVTWQGRAAVR